ncbi:MAG: hypothetical protein Q9220_004620 [cf. Caloplaca sp. 1 TL-2023]
MPDRGDIDPAALSRTDTLTTTISNPLSLSKSNGAVALPSSKAQKTNSANQRIDLEPLYMNLKAAVGDNWGKYKDAISYFILGHLNQNELSSQINPYVCADPNTEHLHNQLIVAIYGNVLRDLPDQSVAPWVSANDKPTILSKPLAGDEAEQRLKREVMQLPARDRRRIKEVPDGPITDPLEMQITRSVHDHALARNFKLPDAIPASAGGQVKTSKIIPLTFISFQTVTSLYHIVLTKCSSPDWEPEIRKRYLPLLSSETFEFPSPTDLHARMIPICYEESLPNACTLDCAEFMSTALEHYMKAVVSNIVGRVRSDLPATNSVGGGVIVTSAHANVSKSLKMKREAMEARKVLGTADIRTSLGVGGWGELAQMPTVVLGVMNGWNEGVLEGWLYPPDYDDGEDVQMEDEMDRGGKRPAVRPLMNGNVVTNGVVAVGDGHDDAMEDEDANWGWAGGAASDRKQLGALLDDCLAVGQRI